MNPQLYWIAGPWRGKLAIALRPRGGEWLEDEVRSWKQSGLDVVVSLLTPEEVADFDLGREEEWCRAHGVKFVTFPITDRGVPESRQRCLALVHQLDRGLAEGRGIAVHCRQGLGRSALLAASLLAASGEDPDLAFQRISKIRGASVPETGEQRDWVRATAASRISPTRPAT